MANKIVDDATKVAEAKKRFGHLSVRVASATNLGELAPALRELAHTKANSAPAICRKVLRFSAKYKLTGI
jgi:hypothetical protein